MDTDTYMRAIRNDAEAMLGAAQVAGLETDVPTCPGWTMRDLMVHTGRVHRHKAEMVRGRYTDTYAPYPPWPEGDVLKWYAEGLDEMLAVFVDADLSAPSYTWCDHDHTADWWVRRMAHETVIHRADALIAAGETPTIEASLAEDGVDEILDEFMIGGPSWGEIALSDRTIRLRSGDREWNLRSAVFSGTSPTTGTSYQALDTLVYDSGVTPMATVTTDPATLDLWLWGRGDLPDGAVDGDVSIVEHLRSLAAEQTG
jgi:uncharacterized protein (TIGR03083 family)